MERQIKFRAKRLDNGKWAYGGLIEADDYCIIDQGNELYVERDYVFRGDTHFFQLSGVMCDEKTIGQFTGLLDKNGNEIYEGDILSANGRIVGWVKGGVRGYCYDVVYVNHPAGEKRWTLYATVMYDYKGEIEITGNIHDNPELISDK